MKGDLWLNPKSGVVHIEYDTDDLVGIKSVCAECLQRADPVRHARELAVVMGHIYDFVGVATSDEIEDFIEEEPDLVALEIWGLRWAFHARERGESRVDFALGRYDPTNRALERIDALEDVDHPRRRFCKVCIRSTRRLKDIQASRRDISIDRWLSASA